MTIDFKTRVALWLANDRRCFFCTEPVSISNLDIDHIIPQKIDDKDLMTLKNETGLPDDFDIESIKNLVPTHHPCNNRKGKTVFNPQNIIYLLELWGRKQSKIEVEIQKFKKQASNDKVLKDIGIAVEKGDLSLIEIVGFLRDNVEYKVQPKNEPIIISFGINLIENGMESNVESCRRLETELIETLNEQIGSIFKETEGSQRTDETISMRFAFWNIDISVFEEMDITPWDILEIAPYSDIYDDDWREVFPEV